MTLHRNTGAPFRRADGSVWERGEIAEPTQPELKHRKYKLKPVVAVERLTTSFEEPEHKAAVAAGEWPLVMSPERYVRLHPKGQYADLAHTLLAPAELPQPEEEEQTDGAADNS